MDPDESLALFRIVQEALNNIIEHADAHEVFINLTRRAGVVRLSVEDDGIGFDFKEATRAIESGKGPLGLSIMKERAIQAGGTMWIETGKGKGATMLVRIPA